MANLNEILYSPGGYKAESDIENIYQELKGQVKNLGTEQYFKTGAAGTKEGGLGSVDNVLRDMAAKLSAAGLTSISELGQRIVPVEDNSLIKYHRDDPDIPYVAAKTTTEYYNKRTGAPIYEFQNVKGGGWGLQTSGDGQTVYSVQFDPKTGLPIFYNQQTHGKQEYADLLKVAAIGAAIFAPQIGAAIAPSLSAGAQMAIGSAISGFVGSGGDLESAIKAGLSSYLGGQVGSWASKASNSALVGNLASNMTRAAILGGKMEDALVSTLVQAAPAEIAKYVPNFKDLPRAAQEAAVAATVDLMRTGGDNLGQIAMQGAASGATDYALSQIDGYNNLRAGQKDVIRQQVSAALTGKPLDKAALDAAINLAGESVRYTVDTERAQKEGWQNLSAEEANKLLADLGLSPGIGGDSGTQYAQAKSGTATDAGGVGEPARFSEIKQGIAGYLGASVGENTGVTQYDDGTYGVKDPANNRVLKFSSDGSYMGTAFYVPSSNENTTKIAQDFIGAFTNSPYAKSFTGAATYDGSDIGTLTGSGASSGDAGFWESIGIDPKSLSTGDSKLSNEEIMALIGYGQSATPPVDGSGKPLLGDVYGVFGGSGLGGFTLVSEDKNGKVYENEGFALIARANGTSALLDKKDPDPEPIWLDPIDTQRLLAQKTPATQPPLSTQEKQQTVPPAANMTPAEVEKIVSDAIRANPSLAAADMQKAVDAAKSELTKAVEKVAAGAASGDADLKKAIDALKAAGLTSADVQKMVDASATNQSAATKQAIADATKSLATSAALENVRSDLAKEIQAAKDLGLAGDAALQAGLNSLAAKMGSSQADLLKQLGTTESALKSQFASQISGLDAKLTAAIADAKASGLAGDAALKAAIDKVAANQKISSTNLLDQLGKTEASLKTQFAAELARTKTQLSNLEKSLSAEIQAAKDIGLAGDQALQAGLNSLAAKMGTNQADVLKQLGTTEAALRTQFATQVSSLDAKLSKAIADAQAAGLAGDAALQSAIQKLATDLGTTKASVLSQLGKTESTLRAEMEAGFAGVSQQYNALSAAQKATADALVAQGKSMQEALAAVQSQTAGQIAGVESRLTDAIAAAEAMGLSRDQAITAAVDSVAAELGVTKTNLLSQLGKTEAALRAELTSGLAGLSAETKAQFNALTAEQKALATQLANQGVSLSSAIAQAQKQTAGQIAGLSADVQAKYNALSAEQKALANSLQQQGVDLNTAINTASAQIRSDVQAKYDALSYGQKSLADQLMQQGLDLRSAIDVTTSQIAAAEAQRQADLAEQARQAQEAEKRAATRTLASQAQTQLQSVMGQLPAAYQALQTTTTPIYAGEMTPFDLGSPLDVDFFSPSEEKQDSQKGQQTTKIATGGYLDDLLDLLR